MPDLSSKVYRRDQIVDSLKSKMAEALKHNLEFTSTMTRAKALLARLERLPETFSWEDGAEAVLDRKSEMVQELENVIKIRKAGLMYEYPFLVPSKGDEEDLELARAGTSRAQVFKHKMDEMRKKATLSILPEVKEDVDRQWSVLPDDFRPDGTLRPKFKKYEYKGLTLN